MPLCSDCGAINKITLKESAANPLPLKSSFELLPSSARSPTSPCSLCALILRTITAGSTVPNPPAIKAVYYCAILVTEPSPSLPSVSSLLVSCRGRSGYLVLAPKEKTAPSDPISITGHFIPSQPDWDFSRNAIAQCSKAHGVCNTMLTGEPQEIYVPPRLYDVNECRLILSYQMFGERYATLSYIWGHSEKLWKSRTLSTNLEKRLKKFDSNDFPSTWSNAIAIAKKLGIGYLWIDGLCVVQDDDEDKKKHFGQEMANIYQCAVVTIVSIRDDADGDCLEPRMSPQQTDSISIASDSIYAIRRISDPRVDIGDESLPPSGQRPVWSSRGWPFQERVLSPRCVYFTSNQMYYECRQKIIEETGIQHPTSTYKRLTSDNGDVRARLRNRWPAMIRDYSRRELRFDSDKIPAISGIAEQLSHSKTEPADPATKFGFFSIRLVRDILWEADGTPLQKQKDLPVDFKPLPTWSWASWNGKIGWETWLETSSPCIDFQCNSNNVNDNNGTLTSSNAKVFPIRLGASQISPPSGPSWLIWNVSHQNLYDIHFSSQGDVKKGWGAFDEKPGADIDQQRLFCVLVSETVNNTGPAGAFLGECQKCANVLLVSPTKEAGRFTRRGVGQVTLDERVFEGCVGVSVTVV